MVEDTVQLYNECLQCESVKHSDFVQKIQHQKSQQ